MMTAARETVRMAKRRYGGCAGGVGGWVVAAVILLACTAGGCVTPGLAGSAPQRDVAAAALPLLELRSDANWTACYNRLLDLGPASVDYLLSRPVMQRRSAPDDLRVMLHTSLLRLLANPARVPRLSVNCFETTLDVLHFDPKVRGRRVGRVRLPTERIPAAWHDLYPADFDHTLGRAIEVEVDRQTMLSWWRLRRGKPAAALARRRLRPRIEHLWPVLSRRYADVWTYEVQPEVFLCSWPPGRTTLFHGTTYDYNLVRAVCIWLGASEVPSAQDRLIDLVAHGSEVIAYNARFALGFSPDPRIREVLERYKEPGGPSLPAGVHTSAALSLPERNDPRRIFPFQGSCGEQGSATHEVAQILARLCVADRDGDVHGGAVRWP